MKKLLTILLAFIFVFTAVSCSGQVPPPNTGDNDPNETGKFLLENGRTEYSIVIPENSSSMENIASEEMINFFYEATGVRLPVIRDNAATYSANAKYISIGNTTLVEQAKVTRPVELETDNAIAIKTVGDSIFCLGGGDYGVAYSVYELLYQMLNFEYFYTDCYSLDTAVTDIPLLDYDIADAPDIVKPVGSVGFMTANPTVARRMRAPYTYNTYNLGDSEVASGGHNTLHYIPYAKYGKDHPGWFSSDHEALCFTAHGDDAELELMISTFVDRLKQVIIYNKDNDKNLAKISNMDVYTSCSCEKCVELYNKYGGADSGAFIIFINEIYNRITDWMANDEEGKQYYIPDFAIDISAYYKYEKAPSYYDAASGEWLPYGDEVVMVDGVHVQIAPIFINYTKSIYDDENKHFLDTILGWKNVSPNRVDFWLYCTNFQHYMYPYDSFNYMQDYYQLLSDMNAVLFNDQTQNGNNGGMTGWHVLKAYLFSKLSYDTTLNLNELTDRFFKGYFGEGAEDMRKFYDSWRRFAQYQQSELGAFQGTYTVMFDINNKKYWPKNVIDTWQGNVTDALEKIKPLQNTDPERYQMLYNHIVMERVFLDYVLLEHYSANLGAKFDYYKNTFVEAVELNNIMRTSEGGRITAYIEQLLQK